MPTPTYVSASNFLKGVSAAETAINVASYRQRIEDPKEYVQDKGGSRTGFVHNFDVSASATITGETNVAALGDTMGVAFGVAETIANAITFTGATGGFYLDDIEFTQDRGSFSECTANLTRITGLS